LEKNLHKNIFFKIKRGTLNLKKKLKKLEKNIKKTPPKIPSLKKNYQLFFNSKPNLQSVKKKGVQALIT
jgi:nitrate reductase cytochrome c-type subunit